MICSILLLELAVDSRGRIYRYHIIHAKKTRTLAAVVGVPTFFHVVSSLVVVVPADAFLLLMMVGKKKKLSEKDPPSPDNGQTVRKFRGW